MISDALTKDFRLMLRKRLLSEDFCLKTLSDDF